MTTPLQVAAAPHLKGEMTTPRIMWGAVGSLVPVVAAATWFFGPSALLVVGSSTLGAVTTERLLGPPGALGDGSAMITGMLLGLTLPAGIPLWMAFLGSVFGIALGKVIFGGLGFNVFNPALLGRAFLQASFPVAITTWPGRPESWAALRGDNFAFPFASPQPDVITEATPLGLRKFEGADTPLWDLVTGSTGGSLGETAGIVILLCGAYLAARNYLNWRTPVSLLATTAVLSGALHLLDAARYPPPLFMLFSGGLLLGAVFMATDPVTSPVTNRGRWIFGAGIAALVVVIRVWGGLPEGVMYAILLMNALVPFINRATQPRVFGTRLAQAAT
ncbi:MAG: RnfABCDGE type electron transport complex subunit D [Gemmatimonadetes bacterium]|nr:RnfABCDGE type electron transport complex subunit D [Gemmatimonadota bacterium]